MIEIQNKAESLQVHYYLTNQSHSMNSITLNKAESEILKIVYEISKILEIDIIAETHALEEGGIKAIYKFLTKKKTKKKFGKLSIYLAGIASAIITQVISENISSDSEFDKLKKQELKLRIEKLKKELNENELEEINEDNIKIIQNISVYISETNKVKISKSNFYKNLLGEDKIQMVSTQRLDNNLEPISKEQVVPRKHFEKFIIDDTSIEEDYKEQIELEIVSPVLRGNSLKWKAIYNGENINFTLKDDNFKNLVLTKNLSFSNGTKMICDLETKQKMTSDGEIKNGARSVYDVSAIIYTDGTKVDIIH